MHGGTAFITGSGTSRQILTDKLQYMYSARSAVQALTGFLAASRVPDDHFYGTLSRMDLSDDKQDGQTSRLAEDQE